MKKTPWFPAKVDPVRVGVYEVKPDHHNPAKHTQFQHWDGEAWGCWAADIRAAWLNSLHPSVRQMPQWRGLAQQPKEKA